MPKLLSLECTRCAEQLVPDVPQGLCTSCHQPLFARYDLSPGAFDLSEIEPTPSMWRYRSLLPVQDARHITSLGEGWTPLLRAPRLESQLEMPKIYVKDESQNPTGSFKDRGLSVVVSRARELGITSLSLPSAGNAGGSLACYAAAGGLTAHIFLQKSTPKSFLIECRQRGADVHLINGHIDEAAQQIASCDGAEEWFPCATLREPYRVEGKKTMGFELFEQLGGELPDAIIFPTGGGTGVIGLWKAFSEMEALGWLHSPKPKMICVQSTGCALLVRAFEAGDETAKRWEKVETMAWGLRVPSAVGDFLILEILRESDGEAIAVTDDEMMQGCRRIGEATGIFACHEGGDTLAGLEKLRAQGKLQDVRSVVLFNTGTGLKYLDNFK